MDSTKIVNPSAKKRPPRAGMGRPAGIPNKVTAEFREAVKNLLEKTSPKMIEWLEDVANGNTADGGRREPDPGKALDLMAKLAEYAAPKLARTEVTGPDGGPVQITAVKRTIIDPKNGT